MHAKGYHDLGTPAPRDTTASVTVRIDGRPVTVPAGTSVMRAAGLAGCDVPKLCATDTLAHFGSCRLCLVEIDGRRGFPASCTTPVAEGMEVRTESAALASLRRSVLELYVSEHPLDCASCPANTHCELQDVAARLGVSTSRYTPDAQPPAAAVNTSHPYFQFDPNLCVVCSRCVRACDEIQGTFALTIAGRGHASRVVASQDEPFVHSECVSCGQCVESCPTGALLERSVVARGVGERAVTTT